MQKHTLIIVSLFALVLLSGFGCAPDEQGGVSGQLLFQNRPLADAQVEVYLKADKDRSVQAFAVTTTDAKGRFEVVLPDGSYFVIGKKKETDASGRSRMLMAESPDNPHRVAGTLTKVAPFSLREMGREGGLVADPETGLAGQVTRGGAPVANAYVYLYTEAEAGLMGPSYGEAVQADTQGRFSVDLPAGRYYLVARARTDGSRSGELEPGDLNGAYPGNPVDVAKGERLTLGPFVLAEIDRRVKAERQAVGTFTPTETVVTGTVADGEGMPVSGVYVFAYLDSRMVGKPVYISAPSGEDGRFNLYLGHGGRYFIGARSAYGGPLEPGEWVGTYDAVPDHSLDVVADRAQSLGTLTVREIW